MFVRSLLLKREPVIQTACRRFESPAPPPRLSIINQHVALQTLALVLNPPVTLVVLAVRPPLGNQDSTWATAEEKRNGNAEKTPFQAACIGADSSGLGAGDAGSVVSGRVALGQCLPFSGPQLSASRPHTAPGSKLSSCLNTPPAGACLVGFGGAPRAVAVIRAKDDIGNADARSQGVTLGVPNQ